MKQKEQGKKKKLKRLRERKKEHSHPEVSFLFNWEELSGEKVGEVVLFFFLQRKA
eukprot:m.138428 g.138428  ORF g.138428 m.138428 type:complete len:55 (-) comp20266_c0_seq1:193-357(-)